MVAASCLDVIVESSRVERLEWKCCPSMHCLPDRREREGCNQVQAASARGMTLRSLREPASKSALTCRFRPSKAMVSLGALGAFRELGRPPARACATTGSSKSRDLRRSLVALRREEAMRGNLRLSQVLRAVGGDWQFSSTVQRLPPVMVLSHLENGLGVAYYVATRSTAEKAGKTRGLG